MAGKRGLSGKRLLLLGTNMGTCDMVRYARSADVYTIVTDYLEPADSAAKQIADEYWMISTADADRLEKEARDHRVDGVFAGVSEFNLERAMMLCERLGLPFYCTRRQWDICSSKHVFKRLCREWGVPVVEEYSNDGNFTAEEQHAIRYPVIVKPADSSAGRGISICYREEEVTGACARARSFSPTGKVIVERYMTGTEATLFYVARNGRIFLTAMGDRYTRHRQGGTIPLPVAHIFPSRHLSRFIESVNEKVIAMFGSLGIANGNLFIQAMVENGNCYCYEMGFRLTGTQEYHILSDACGLNPLEMMVDYALTGSMGDQDIQLKVNPVFEKNYCLINFLVKPGTIGEISLARELPTLPGVLAVVHEHKPDDVIPEDQAGTLKQIALRVFAKADTMKQLAALMGEIHRSVEIVSTSGENLLLSPLDLKEVYDE